MESLSYLILPCLTECAFFGEAWTHHKAVLKFHHSAKRETSDQMVQCLDHANYMKSLELHEFTQLCAK